MLATGMVVPWLAALSTLASVAIWLYPAASPEAVEVNIRCPKRKKR
jgi:hypothetical protein